MSRMLCICGYTLSNSTNPEIQYVVYSDDEWIKILEDETIKSPIDIPFPSINVWRCPKCERIFIWDNKSPVPIKVYKLEE